MRASYRYGVRWIAENDEPEEMDAIFISEFISTSLLADLFGKTPMEVAKAVVRFKRRNQ